MTSAIFSFYWTWTDFLPPLLYLSKPSLYTVSVALRLFAEPDLAACKGPRIGADHGRRVAVVADDHLLVVDATDGHTLVGVVLAEQREVEHDHPLGRAVLVDLALDLRLHRRVDDAVEVLQRRFVLEHDRRDGSPIEGAVVEDDVLTEALGHRVEHRTARRLEVAGDLIGIDDDGAALGEHRRHGRLAGADTAGQPDQDHPSVSSSTAGASAASSAGKLVPSARQRASSSNRTEVFWLNAIRRDTNLRVVTPVPRRDGEYISLASMPGLPPEPPRAEMPWGGPVWPPHGVGGY